MRTATLAIAAVLALGSTAMAAESTTTSPGASGNTPGHQMQDKGAKAGSPGASGYAPGHEMKGSTTGSTSGSTGGTGMTGTKGTGTTGTGGATTR
jgi:hypothetical protein